MMKVFLVTLLAMASGVLSGCVSPLQESPLLLQASAWWETGPTNRIVCVPLITNISGEPVTVHRFGVSVDGHELMTEKDPSSLGGLKAVGGEPMRRRTPIQLLPAEQIFTRVWIEDYGTNRTVLLTITCNDTRGSPFPMDSRTTWEGDLTITIAVPPSSSTPFPDIPEHIQTNWIPLWGEGQWFKNAEHPPKAHPEPDLVVRSQTEAYELMYSYLWQGATDSYFEQPPAVARGAMELCINTMDQFLNEDFMPSKYLQIRGELALFLFDHAIMHARLGKLYERLAMPEEARRQERAGFNWYKSINWPADCRPEQVATNLQQFIEMRDDFDKIGNPIRLKL